MKHLNYYTTKRDKNALITIGLGDFSGWMIEHLAGITVNPNCTSPDEFVISPKFIDELDFVTASHDLPKGKITSSWKRDGNHIILTLDIPEGVAAR